jgi:hypothetical protein
MRLTASSVNSATTSSVLAIVNVPTGGRKKKLKQAKATNEAATATRMLETVATTRTASTNDSATVVSFISGSYGRRPIGAALRISYG